MKNSMKMLEQIVKDAEPLFAKVEALVARFKVPEDGKLDMKAVEAAILESFSPDELMLIDEARTALVLIELQKKN